MYVVNDISVFWRRIVLYVYEDIRVGGEWYWVMIFSVCFVEKQVFMCVILGGYVSV